MPGIVMNVGPSMAGSGGAGNSGGQTLGAAQGTITINVRNVTQANTLLQNSAKTMSESFKLAGKEARANSQIQIAAAKTAAAQTASAAQVIIAGHKVTTASAAAASAQQKRAHLSVVQSIQQVALQTRVAAAQQRTSHQAAMQPIQQQIAANRLIVSGLNTQAVQARAAGRAQQQAALAAQTGWQKFNQQLGDIRSELIGLSVASGLLAASGLQYAGTLQEARIQLEAMTGSQEAAADLMDDLASKGRQAGIPLRQMLTFATQLLPTLHGETKELEKWFDIIRRTATLNRGPTGGVQGATFSLREAFLSFQAGGKDFVSIADRFNISKISLAQALENAMGDSQEEKFLNAMEAVLTQMGITTEMADRMGKTFNASFELARDGAMRLLAEGFGPLLEVLGPALQGLADVLNKVADTSPEVAIVGSSLLAIVAVGAPLLLFVNQLTLAWTNMGLAAQTATLRMGKIGLVAAGATAGFAFGREVGIRAGGLIRQIRGNEPLSREQVNTNANNVAFNIFAAISRAGDAISRALQRVAASIIDGVAFIQRVFQDINNYLAEQTKNVPGISSGFAAGADRHGQLAFTFENMANEMRRQSNVQSAKMFEDIISMARSMNVEGFERPSQSRSGTGQDEFTVEQEAEMVDHYQNLQQITRSANREITEEMSDWGRERARTVADYNKNLLREARDFGRQRAEQERQFNQQILDMASDAAYQREQWMEDFEKNIQKKREDLSEQEAEIREDSQKRILEIEEDYAKDREKSFRDHRDRILEAASNLDADAIRKEQLRFSRERQDADDAHKKAIGDEKESLDERLEDQRDAFEDFEKEQKESLDERFQQQKEDDERQLTRMKRDFEDQKKQQDDERRIRLDDQHQDHLDQLAEMDAQHALRIEQIHTHAAEERDAAWDDHQENMAQLGIMTEAWRLEQEQLVASAIAVHRQFWREQAKIFHTTQPGFPSLANPYALVGREQLVQQGPMPRGGNVTIGNVVLQIVGGGNMSSAQWENIIKNSLVRVFEDFSP